MIKMTAVQAQRLYRVAKELSDSFGDNYGSEAADSGIYEFYFSEEARDKLARVLGEIESGGKSKRKGVR